MTTIRQSMPGLFPGDAPFASNPKPQRRSWEVIDPDTGLPVVGDDLSFADLGEEEPPDLPDDDDEDDAPFGQEDWQPYQGPRGGKGWKHARTGRIQYGEHRPGSPEERKANEARARETVRSLASTPAQTKISANGQTIIPGAADAMFGDAVPAENLHTLFGVPGGGEAWVSAGTSWDSVQRKSVPNPSKLEIHGFHPAIQDMSRTLTLDPDGTLVCSNNLFFLKRNYRGTGLGASVFAGQVRTMASAGVDEIHTCAGRGGGMNGYYTWPRLGYNTDMEDDWLEKMPRKAEKLFLASGATPEEAKARAKALGRPETVLDLMATPDGREVWKKYGYMTSMAFDLRQGSRSLATLNAYLAEKGKPPLQVDEARGQQIREGRQAKITAAKAEKARKDQISLDRSRAAEEASEAGAAAAKVAGVEPKAVRELAMGHYNVLANRALADKGESLSPDDIRQAMQQSWEEATAEAVRGVKTGDTVGEQSARQAGHDPEALRAQAEAFYGYAARRDTEKKLLREDGHQSAREWGWWTAVAHANYSRHLQRIHNMPEVVAQAEEEAAREYGLDPEEMRGRAAGVVVGLPDAEESIRVAARSAASLRVSARKRQQAQEQPQAQFSHASARLTLSGPTHTLDTLAETCRLLGLTCRQPEATFAGLALRQALPRLFPADAAFDWDEGKHPRDRGRFARKGEASEPPITAVLARFPGAQMRGSTGLIPNGDGRHIALRPDMLDPNTVMVAFFAGEASSPDYEQLGRGVQSGTMDLMRKLSTVLDTLKATGTPASYVAEPRHRGFYERMFGKKGWTRTTAEEGEGGQAYDVWTPPGATFAEDVMADDLREADLQELADLFDGCGDLPPVPEEGEEDTASFEWVKDRTTKRKNPSPNRWVWNPPTTPPKVKYSKTDPNKKAGRAPRKDQAIGRMSVKEQAEELRLLAPEDITAEFVDDLAKALCEEYTRDEIRALGKAMGWQVGAKLKDQLALDVALAAKKRVEEKTAKAKPDPVAPAEISPVFPPDDTPRIFDPAISERLWKWQFAHPSRGNKETGFRQAWQSSRSEIPGERTEQRRWHEAIGHWQSHGFFGQIQKAIVGREAELGAKEIAADMDNALQAAPAFPEPVITWRAVKELSPSEALEWAKESLESGEPAHWDHFTGSSLNPRAAVLFSGWRDQPSPVLLEINTKNGIYIGGPKGEDEAEVLLPRQQPWKVVGIKHVDMPGTIDGKAWVVQMVPANGTITDSLGRKVTFRDGKRVAGEEEAVTTPAPGATPQATTPAPPPTPSRADALRLAPEDLRSIHKYARLAGHTLTAADEEAIARDANARASRQREPLRWGHVQSAYNAWEGARKKESGLSLSAETGTLPVEPKEPAGTSKMAPRKAPAPEHAEAPWEMTRADFAKHAWSHGTSKEAAESIAKQGKWIRGEFAPPDQMNRGIDYGFRRGGLTLGQIAELRKQGIPEDRKGMVFFGRKVREGEKADVGGRVKVLGSISYDEAVKDPHRAFVEKALVAGHPVPAEVLADYPDLAGKAGA